MIVVDTSVLVAASNRRDRDYLRCAKLLLTAAEPLAIPEALLTEIGYMLLTRTGPAGETAFLHDVATGAYNIVSFEEADYHRLVELTETYANFPLGTADAAVVTAAEKLRTPKIATLDRRHFTAVRLNHVSAPTLLP